MYQETKLAQTSISSINSIKTWQQRVVNEIILQVKEVCEKCPGVLLDNGQEGKIQLIFLLLHVHYRTPGPPGPVSSCHVNKHTQNV